MKHAIILLECCKGMTRRIFTNVVDIRENEYSIYVYHRDPQGEKIQAMIPRGRVVSVEWITDAELEHIKGSGKYDKKGVSVPGDDSC